MARHGSHAAYTVNRKYLTGRDHISGYNRMSTLPCSTVFQISISFPPIFRATSHRRFLGQILREFSLA